MNEDLKRWDEEAEQWDRELRSKKRIGKLILDTAFEELLGDVKNKYVIDLGCGNGRLTALIRSLGARVVGVDGSPKMIGLAKRSNTDLDFRVSDLLAPLSFNDSEFDVITAANVLMSLNQIDVFLSESNRILKRDGYVVISVLHPAFNEPTMRLYRPWWYRLTGKPVVGLAENYFQKTTQRKDDYGSQPWPYYHRTIQEYFDLFRKHNFQIDRITEPNNVPVDVLEKNRTHYAKRLPRFMLFKLTKPSR